MGIENTDEGLDLATTSAALLVAAVKLDAARKKLARRKGALTPSIERDLDDARDALIGLMDGLPSSLVADVVRKAPEQRRGD